MRFVGSNILEYYDNFHSRLSADFQRSHIAMVFNEITNYDFILPSKQGRTTMIFSGGWE